MLNELTIKALRAALHGDLIIATARKVFNAMIDRSPRFNRHTFHS
jgi:hypothetical protein